MAKLTKEEKKAKKAERKAAGKGLFNEFKAFLNRGNALMLAIGVVIGGAFSAIVNAFTNILLNAVTAVVPGGITGLVTPIITDTAKNSAASAGLDPNRLVLSAQEWLNLADTSKQGLYVNYGGNYYYSGLPILNWGALINAIISFIIIGLVLFIIVKVFTAAAKKKEALAAKAREAYYEKHPEERPVEPEPEAPKPTQEELLTAILAELKKNNAQPKK